MIELVLGMISPMELPILKRRRKYLEKAKSGLEIR